MKNCHKSSHLFSAVCGSATMGERGQIVVPKEARTSLKIKTGDRFVIFEHDGFLVLVPDKMMSIMMASITKALKK
ncbi:MAG: AbrB/MazE/SpoVT family DNA-binding domain-containing protein [Candidatus Magasanikbacteria bacterium]